MKRYQFYNIQIILILYCVVPLYAGTPIGFPGNLLEQGQWRIGTSFTMSETDHWEAQGSCMETVIGVGSNTYDQRFTLENFKTNAIFGEVAFGIGENWDVFGRLGGVQGETTIVTPGASIGYNNSGQTYLDGDYGFAGGFGARGTLYRQNHFHIGGVIQGTWFDPDDSRLSYSYPSPSTETLTTEASLNYIQIHLSLAGIYQTDTGYLWIGPFLQHTEGELEISSEYAFNGVKAGEITCSGDLDSDTQLGIHLGGGFQLDQVTGQLELQLTSDSWSWSCGAVFEIH